MMKYATIGLMAAVLAACSTPQVEEPDTFTIAFGSCATQDSTNHVWPLVAAHKPDVFVWLGDNIYGDSQDSLVLAEKYARQKVQPMYQDFLKTGVPVIGTWDDHDYGGDDAGKEFPIKAASKRLALRFLDVPANAEVRSHDGLYQSYTYGRPGRQVKVILLDTRWFRDSLARDTTGKARFTARPDGDVLGEAQWQWLAGQLHHSDAQVHIICSSIQVVSDAHGWEKWGNFTAAHQRLYALLDTSTATNLIILSGDRHHAEVSKRLLPTGKALFDITSSGMTHVFARPSIEPNPYRQGPLIVRRNWGLLTIAWAEQTPTITAELRGLGDTLYHSQVLK